MLAGAQQASCLPLSLIVRRQERCSAQRKEKEMPDRFASPLAPLIFPLVFLNACTLPARLAASDAEQLERIRKVESERLQSLVSADLFTARRLHADDFQLVNPVGVALTKTEYLGQIESGQLDYRAWESGPISVRLYGDAAMIRYRDVRFDVDFNGKPVHRGPMYHTNLYERRNGQWQIVWSQASGIITPPAR
jgi:hypothetical protein